MQSDIGYTKNGEENVIIHGTKEALNYIKKKLETSFEVTIWTDGLAIWQIKHMAELLEKNGIVSCFDEVINAFLCFKTKEEMNEFYKGLQKEANMKNLNIEIQEKPISEIEKFINITNK